MFRQNFELGTSRRVSMFRVAGRSGSLSPLQRSGKSSVLSDMEGVCRFPNSFCCFWFHACSKLVASCSFHFCQVQHHWMSCILGAGPRFLRDSMCVNLASQMNGLEHTKLSQKSFMYSSPAGLNQDNPSTFNFTFTSAAWTSYPHNS